MSQKWVLLLSGKITMTQELGKESPLMLFSSAVGGLSCREVYSGLFLISSKSRWPARGPIKTQCTFVGRIIVEVTFQEAHLLRIILCLPFVLEMKTQAIQMGPSYQGFILFLCLNRSKKKSNRGRFFAFGPYHCILNERISGGIKEADPSVTCVRSIAEYAGVHLLTAVVRIIVDCIATKFHLENCKFSLCSTTQYPCLMWYTVPQSHSVKS